MIRRNLYIYVALALAIPHLWAQEASTGADQPEPGLYHARPPAGLYRRPVRQEEMPATRYSPLAAAGGYGRPRLSYWDIIVNAVNPHHLNLGQWWEERRQNWLENVGANPYFWYSFWTTCLLILSGFTIFWIHNDRTRETWALAEYCADALRYAEHCKRRAKEAISRYNAHVDKCNRVIEDQQSQMTTPGAANLKEYQSELKKLRADNESLKLQNEQMKSQLEKKETAIQALLRRIENIEQSFKKPAGTSGNPELVERIRRLEEENRRLSQRPPSPKAEKPPMPQQQDQE